MANKKKRKKRNQKKKILILATAGVLVLAAAGAAGVLLYQNVFSGSREDVLEEYMACIEEGDYEKLYTYLDSSSQELVFPGGLCYQKPDIYEGIEVSDIQLDIPKKSRTGDSPCLTV